MIHPGAKNEIFNLTYGESRSIRELIGLLEGHFTKLEVDFLPKDRLDPERGTLCVDKAKDKMGYAPQYRLEEGLKRYIDFYDDYLRKGETST